MKKSLLLVTLSISLLLTGCNSCGNKKAEPGSVKDMMETYAPISEMSTGKADTAEVMKQVQAFLNELKNRKTDGAMKMLYYLEHDSIKPIPPRLAERELQVLGMVEGATKYEVENLTFFKEKDSEVRIMVTLFDKPANDPAPNQMGMIVKPVRRDGKWYLTLADTQSDSNHGTEIQN